MNKFLVLASVLFFVSFVSCKKYSQPSAFTVDTTQIGALENFKVNEIDFTYFHFKSKVEYVSGPESQNFTVNGRIKKDSVIWLSITPGLGIEAVRCLILKDSIFLLDRIHNKLFTYGFSYLNNTFNTNINFGNLQAMLVGNLAAQLQPTDKLVKQDDIGILLLRQYRQNSKIDNSISTKTLKVENLEMLNIENNDLLSVRYSEFAPLDTFLFANKVKSIIKFADKTGKENTTIVDIHHTKAEIVAKPLNFPFNVPKRFEEK
jgi:hypothetical protein